jgi:site-specific DNA recombinase
VGLYVDPAISGTKESRPAIDQLKRDVRRHRVPRVLFYRVNRIGRNVRASYATADEVESCGAEVVSATETFDRMTASGRLTFGMLAVMAEFGSNQLKEVMQKTLAGKAKNGLWVGPVPLGYERDGKTLRPSADAPVIVSIFTLYATSRHSYTSIADLLNEQGHGTLSWRTGERGLFGRESIRTILKNRAYLGYVSSGGVEFMGNQPALISKELWAKATAVREGRTEQGGVVKVKPVCPGLLTGLVYCAECGENMWNHWSGREGHRIRYYLCSGRSARTCKAPYVHSEPVEQQILAILGSLQLNDNLWAAVKAEAQRLLGIEQTPPAVDAEAIRAQLERLGEVYADGLMSKPRYEQKRDALLSQLGAAPAMPATPDLDGALKQLTDMPRMIAAANLDERKDLVRSVFSHIWAAGKKIIAITPRGVFLPLFALWQSKLGCLTGLEPATS